ncbi:MAG TPA: hypothetical protein VGQ90_08675 [Stellaceae bacterium]|jgi:hypothetical protein|nr:hypothetical protein [Stellaceae bacterium]
MTRVGAVFWLVLVLLAGFTTFKVKHAVQDVEDQLNRVRKQTIAEQQEIRVLTAEWTYLNQPERLAELNRRFFNLWPITAKQLQRGIADIPMRTAPAAAEILLASAAEPAEPQPLDGELQVTPAALATAPAAAERKWPDRPATRSAHAADHPAGPGQMQLAKADRVDAPHSLDALIAQIADSR